MVFVKIENCNNLPIVQSAIQTFGGSLAVWLM